MPAAAVNGVNLTYDVSGGDDGQPLLLVMGLGGQLVRWPEAFVAKFVAKGFRVIRFDNRDSGLSTKTGGEPPGWRDLGRALVRGRKGGSPYLLSDMADDAAALLSHLDIEQAHIVGASMGGMIAQLLAIEHPRRVLSLTSIMSNTGDRRHGGISGRLLRQLPRLRGRSDPYDVDRALEVGRLVSGPAYDEALERDLVEQALARDADPNGMMHQLRAILASPDRTAGLRGVTTPTLVIHGLADPLVKPSGGMATARAVPGSRLLMFPDMGHDLPEVRWDEVVEAIADNAARATPPPAFVTASSAALGS